MKKRLLSILLVAALLLELCGSALAVSEESDTATGTADAPFEISTVKEFVAFLEEANNTSGTTRHYRLTADIRAEAGTAPLTGYTAHDVVLDGGGHSISGFAVTDAIFSKISASTFRQVVFSDMTVTASGNSAAVLALDMDATTKILGCTFQKCTVSQKDKFLDKVAIIACASQASIVNCTVADTCVIRGDVHMAGGLAAENGKNGIIVNCVCHVSIPHAAGIVGTLVGQNAGGLRRCYGRVPNRYGLYDTSTGPFAAVINCLKREKGQYVQINGKSETTYDKDMDLRILAADMSLGAEKDNMQRMKSQSTLGADEYGCPWAVENEDLALSLDGRTAQVYLYADDTMNAATFTFTDEEVLPVEIATGRKFSVRVGRVEDGVFTSNRVAIRCQPGSDFTVVNSFLYKPDQDYVKTLPNRIDGVAGVTYVDLHISADTDPDTGVSTGSTVLYPYCATVSLTNTQKKDEVVEHHFVGSGTAEDPYRISGVYELECLSYYVNNRKYNGDLPYNEAHYVLTCDLDMSGQNFIPIGAYSRDFSTAFRGVFDGQGYEIRGLSTAGYNGTYQGLFGYTAGRMVEMRMVEAVIRNLNLRGAVIGTNGSPQDLVGGIVGEANNTLIDGCVVQGTITGQTQVGGIAGYAYRSRIINCGANVDITTWSYCAWSGGITGYSQHTTIENCYSASTFVNQNKSLKNYLHTGAIAGRVLDSEFDRCYYLEAEEIDVGRETAGIEVITEDNLRSPEQVARMQTYSDDKGVSSLWEQGNVMDWNEGYPTIRPAKNRLFRVTCEPTTAGNVYCADGERYVAGKLVLVKSDRKGLRNLILVDAQGKPLEVPVTHEGGDLFTFTMPSQNVWIIPDYGVSALCGHGTEANPYWIRSWQDLEAMANLINTHAAPAEGCAPYASAHYRMIQDVNGNGQVLTPINHFSGQFDGNGHRIFKAQLHGNETAMFENLVDGQIRNLVLDRIVMWGRESALLAHSTSGNTLLSNIMVLDLECHGSDCSGLVYTNQDNLTISNCLVEDAVSDGSSNAMLVQQSGNLTLRNVLISDTEGFEKTVCGGSEYVDADNVFFNESTCQDVELFGQTVQPTLDLVASLSVYAQENLGEGACLWTVANMDSSTVRPRLSYCTKGAIVPVFYDQVFSRSKVKLLDDSSWPTTTVVGSFAQIPYFVNSSTAELRIMDRNEKTLDFTLEPDQKNLTAKNGVIRFEVPASAVHIDNNNQPLRQLYLEGNGTQENPYQIDSDADLLLMADVINGRQLQYLFNDDDVRYYAAWFILTDDIDMLGQPWEGIGTGTYNFGGVFDGNRHTISNLNVNNGQGNTACPGLFLSIAEGGVVENLSVSGAYVFPGGVMNAAGVIAHSNEGTIARCQVDNATVILGNYEYLGGIAGVNKGTIIQCAVRNTVLDRIYGGSGTRPMGGITQHNEGTVHGCYVYGCSFTDGSGETDAIVASGNRAPVYCYYYIEGSAVGSKRGTFASKESFASGEMTYKLNCVMDPQYQLWGQKLGEEPYPVLWGAKVYPKGDCTHIDEYTNDDKARYGHEYDENGFCIYCGFYEPAVKASDGWYEIYNVGQLYWFAALVNGDVSKAEITFSDKHASGRIMVPLDMSVTRDAWKPIGSNKVLGDGSTGAYTGGFDGGLLPIKNLNGMLFGTTSGARLRNIAIESGTFSANPDYATAAGSIAGVMLNNSLLERSYSKATMSSSAMCDVGGLVGHFENSKMLDCFYAGFIDNRYNGVAEIEDAACVDMGGLVGCLVNSSPILQIWNCFAYTTIMGGDSVGGLFGRRIGEDGNVTQCYYNRELCGYQAIGNILAPHESAKLAEFFASGELTYTLQSNRAELVWGQNLDNGQPKQDYPVLLGARVYTKGTCQQTTGYSNAKSQSWHEYDDNGFCIHCGAFQPATDADGDGVYEISNAGQLFWFAAVVNGGYEDTPQNTGANAIVTKDIKYSYYTIERPWAIIGSPEKPYVGTFDGQGHKLSVLSIFNFETLVDYTGMFGYIGKAGVVRNVDAYCFMYGVGYVGGIAGYNAGTIENCVSSGNMYFSGNNGGGIAGYNAGTITGCVSQGLLEGDGANVGGIAGLNDGTVSDCYFAGAINGATRLVGGIVGLNDANGTVSHCYSVGSLPGASEYVGFIAGEDRGEIRNCYYKLNLVYNENGVQQYGIGTSLADGALADVSGRTEEKTFAQFYSGEVTYLLQNGRKESVWGQNLDNGQTRQDYPVLRGAWVYTKGNCTGITGYSNTDGLVEGHRYDDNGFCVHCGGYQPATDVDGDGVYEIANAGQFFWFAAVVNGGYEDTQGDYNAKAILSKDINLENRAWKPIGSGLNPYGGTFDGRGHKITGLMAGDGVGQNVGLFGVVSGLGKIQNVGIAGGTVSGSTFAGGIAGQSYGTIERCFNTAEVSGTTQVGGIVGVNYGVISDCYHIGAVKGTDGVGGIAGYSSKEVSYCYHVGSLTQTEGNPGQIIGRNEGTVKMCYYLADAETEDGKTKAQFQSGEVTYLLQDNRAQLVWGQNLDNDQPKQDYPVLQGAKVYVYGNCSGVMGYSNTAGGKSGHEYNANGFCIHCGAYQPATDEDGNGAYEIRNAGQLFWFAAVVNTGYEGTPRNAKAYAELTMDIDLEGRVWAPIGSPYQGIFDGKGYVITGLTVNAVSDHAGLFGYVGEFGAVQRVGVAGGSVKGMVQAGGIAGQNDGAISDCYYTGTVSGAEYVGGIVGVNNGRVMNCYTGWGSVAGSGAVENCYYLADTATEDGGRTAEQFASGQVAYLLQDGREEKLWGQNLDNNQPKQDYPALRGAKVYQGGPCHALQYSNSPLTITHEYDNGFCIHCDAYQPATDWDGDGVYEISNGGQLYWFAELVNGGQTDAGAILTADIVVNRDMSSSNLRPWVAIGVEKVIYTEEDASFMEQPFAGKFDGKGYSISGLYCYLNPEDEGPLPDAWSVGLFGTIGGDGVVMNVALKNTSFIAYQDAGGIAAKNYGRIQNCTSDAAAYAAVAGGIAAENYGEVTRCVNAGSIHDGLAAGGIIGWHVVGDVRGCINRGTVGDEAYKASTAGGIVGQSKATVEQCENSGTVRGQWFIGGIVGQNCKDAPIERCFNTGAISAKQVAGGVAGSNDGIIRYCYNSGSVEVSENYSSAGGVAGSSKVKLESCYNIGTVRGNGHHVGSILGEGANSLEQQNGKFCVKDCYYLIGCATDGNGTVQNGQGADKVGQATADVEGKLGGMTAEQFHSGEVTYLLNGSTSEGELAWGQNLDNGQPKQDYPVLDGAVVYYASLCEKLRYSNHSSSQGHYYNDNGFCIFCDAYQPATNEDGDGEYEIANAGQFFWYASVVNGGYGDTPGDAGARAILTKDIDLEDRNWIPIGTVERPYTGQFDGRGHVVSGLYAVETIGRNDRYVGLFGYVGEVGMIQRIGLEDSTVGGGYYTNYVGGIAGYSAGVIKWCYNGATVTGDYIVGGIAGATDGAISDCYNIGTVRGDYSASGITGEVGDGGAVTRCHNVGSVTARNGYASPIVLDVSNRVSDCYYLAAEENGKGGKTAAQFQSGEVAYLLQDGRKELVWGQNLDNGLTNSGYPVLQGAPVYVKGDCVQITGYSNIEHDLGHTMGDDEFCDRCGYPWAKIAHYTLSLQGNIAVNFYARLHESVLADPDAYMQMTMADGTVLKIPVSQGLKRKMYGKTYYMFSCPLAAKEMTDQVVAQVFHSKGSTAPCSKSIRDYAMQVLEDDTNTAYTEELRSLVTAMLRYGGAAQRYFDYNLDDLADAGLPPLFGSGLDIEGTEGLGSQGTERVKLSSVGLILESETTMRLLFRCDPSVTGFTVTCRGQELEARQRDGWYFVDLENISARDLSVQYQLVVNDGYETATITCNPLDYCKAVWDDQENKYPQELKDVAHALYIYSQAAAEYFDTI